MLEKLSSGDIYLDRLKVSDAESIYQAVMFSKKEISPWLSWLNARYNLNSCKEFIRLQNTNWESQVEFTYAIKNHSDDILGMIGLHLFDSQNDVACIGYWMNTKYANNGICTKALKLLVKNSLLPLNLIRIEVIVAVNNIASQRVVVKAGGVFESVLKNRIRLNGAAIDAHIYCFT